MSEEKMDKDKNEICDECGNPITEESGVRVEQFLDCSCTGYGL